MQQSSDITKLDFFGKYLSRNSYQMLISNFHCAPNSQNPPKGSPGHDPLHKIRPLVRMCQDNFHLKYRAGRFLSLDEGGCGFRGKVNFGLIIKTSLKSGLSSCLKCDRAAVKEKNPLDHPG